MNASARLFRAAICLLILLPAAFGQPQGEALVHAAPLSGPMGANREFTAARFSVTGVVFVDGYPFALLTDNSFEMSRLIRAKERNPEYSAREITREQVILTEPRSGKELRIPVIGSLSEKTSNPAGPAPFSNAWINSRANPMRHGIVSLPDEICRNWAEVTEAGRKEVAVFYEQYGWKLVSAENIRGLADFVWERTDHAEQIAAAQALRDNFAKHLSPEQTQLWQQIRSYQAIYAVEGKMPPGSQAIIAERGRVFAQFKSTLTAEQVAAYEDVKAHPVRPEKPKYSLPVLSAEATATGPTPYSKAWINSPANPMLRYPPSLPGELRDNWAALTIAEKAQVVEFYQKHGWQILLMETVSGAANDSSWRNIYEKERTAVLKANREAFLKLLSPEQSQAWQHKPSNQLIYVADGIPDYARYRTGAEQQKFFDQFWSTLNPEQKAAYERMNDFTKGDWK